MTNRRRHQIGAGLIVLSLAVLAVDKFLLGGEDGAGPESALAEHVSDPALAGPSISGPSVAEAASVSVDLLLDQRLREYESFHAERDPFALSEVMTARLNRETEEEIPKDVPEPIPELPDRMIVEFQSEHRLEGVLESGRASVAIVDGLAVRVGQSIDGFRLVEVEVRSATFERDGTRVTLNIPVE